MASCLSRPEPGKLPLAGWTLPWSVLAGQLRILFHILKGLCLELDSAPLKFTSFLEPHDVILFGNRVFADMTGGDGITLEQGDPYHCCVLRATGKFGPSHAQRRKPCED